MKLSIHTVLLAMIAALIAPAAVFLGLIVYDAQIQRTAQILRSGDRLAAEVALRLENEFRSARTMLAVFASSGWLEDNDLDELHRRAHSALRGTNRYLIVVDENGQQLLNTRVPLGTPLGVSGDVETIPRVLESGIDAVSNLFEGRVAGTKVYNVLSRTTLPGGEKRVLILTRNAKDLEPILSQNIRFEGWSIGVFDGAGQPVYAAIDGGDSLADLENCEPNQALADTDWTERHQVVRRIVRPSDWQTCAWADTQRVIIAGGPGQLTFMVLWAIGAVVAAVGLGFMLSRSIAGAARVAEALAADAEVPAVSSPIRELDEVLTALVAAARIRQEKDAELALVAREASHRAKNQLAIATSILRLAARGADSTEELVEDMSHRLTALGRSVDTMIGGTLNAAPLARLVELQLRPFINGEDELLTLEGAHFAISQSAAQSLGLILHEFATNASKYGALASEGGHVRVGWHVAGEDLVLVWQETSPTPAEAPTSQGFGTNLIDFIVTRSFGGTIEREFGAEGFRATITVPTDAIAGAPGGDGTRQPAPPT